MNLGLKLTSRNTLQNHQAQSGRDEFGCQLDGPGVWRTFGISFRPRCSWSVTAERLSRSTFCAEGSGGIGAVG